MTASVGLVGGLGPESTIDYYRRVLEAWRRVDPSSSPSIVIDSLDVARGLRLAESDHPGLAAYLLDSVRRLAAAGVDFVAITANTGHLVFDELAAESPVPLVSIVETCAAEARRRGFVRLGILGTRFTMGASFYPEVVARHGIAVIAPSEADRVRLHEHYVGELLKGDFRAETRAWVVSLVERLRREHAIDGVILGGTELPLLLRDDAVAGLPALDTTALHVDAIVERLRSDERTARVERRAAAAAGAMDSDDRARAGKELERRVKDRRRRLESVAKSMTRSALLMGQAEGLVAAWERLIDADAAPAVRAAAGERPDAATLLADLERDLADLERQVADLRREAAEETAEAVGWEARAAAAAREGRGDLARHAQQQQRTHADYAAAIGVEADALDEARAWYRSKVSALRAGPAPQGAPRAAEARSPQ